MFGLGKYQPVFQPISRLGRYAILADADGWTMLSDDPGYTLWNMKTTRPALCKIATTCEVFACLEGDAFPNFEYIYFVGGKVVREYVVGLGGGRPIKNFGTMLPSEAAVWANGGYNIGVAVAACLGIKTRFRADEVRVYKSPPDVTPPNNPA